MEQPYKHDHSDDREDAFGGELRIGQAIEREKSVEKEEGGDLQNYLPEDGKDQRFFSHTGRLENAYGNKVHTEEGEPQAETAQEARSIRYDSFVLNKETGQSSCAEEISGGNSHNESHGDFYGEKQCVLHALNVPAGIVIADKGHDSLGQPHRDLHGDHIDFLSDSHSRHGVGAEGGGKIVEDRHTCYVQQILDRSRDTYAEHAFDDGTTEAEHTGADADICIPPAEEEQNKKVKAGYACLLYTSRCV